jgi:hypothetical protein
MPPLKETRLQIIERNKREIRNRTEARIKALLNVPSVDEPQSEENNCVATEEPASNAPASYYAVNLLLVCITLMLILVIVVLTQLLFLMKQNAKQVQLNNPL